MRRPMRAAALAALLGLAPVEAAQEARVGVLVASADAESAEAAAAFAAGLRAGPPRGITLVERAVEADQAAVAAALAEMRVEQVDVVVALGDAATQQVARAVRELPIVFATPDAAAVAALRRGGNACAATGADAAALASDLRRAVPGLRRLAVLVPPGDEAAEANAADLEGETDVVRVTPEGADAAERARSAAARLETADALWLPPSVTGQDAAALAQALEARGVPLLGSRRRHLDAGCAAVVRPHAGDLGAHAAVLVLATLDGADPGRLPLRRLRRRLVEVNLPSARRLRFDVPLLLLASADEVLRGRTAPR